MVNCKEKKKARKHDVYELFLIGVTGFEPTTPSSLTKCASQLRYTPIFNLKFLLFNRQMLLYMLMSRNASPFSKNNQEDFIYKSNK